MAEKEKEKDTTDRAKEAIIKEQKDHQKKVRDSTVRDTHKPPKPADQED